MEKYFVKKSDEKGQSMEKKTNLPKQVQEIKTGSVRVGRYDYKNKKCPKTPGYTNILIHVKDKLSPYILKDETGALMENIWQFSKVYKTVSRQQQKLHRWTSEPGWHWGSETHYCEAKDQLYPQWLRWHEAGLRFEHPVRYPNGYHGRIHCQFVLSPDFISRIKASEEVNDAKNSMEFKEEGVTKRRKLNGAESTTEMILLPQDKLSIPQGRLRVYYTTYAKLVRADPFYAELRKRLQSGENFQIVEVDGPPIGVSTAPFDQVVDGSIHVDSYVAGTWLKSSYSFGHGICLAVALLDGDSWLEESLKS